MAVSKAWKTMIYSMERLMRFKETFEFECNDKQKAAIFVAAFCSDGILMGLYLRTSPESLADKEHLPVLGYRPELIVNVMLKGVDLVPEVGHGLFYLIAEISSLFLF